MNDRTVRQGPLDSSLICIADDIRERKTCASAVVEGCLDAIAKAEHSGFVRVREAARQEAARADAAATPSGTLHGIPFARKDMYFRAGDLCECGSRILAGQDDQPLD